MIAEGILHVSEGKSKPANENNIASFKLTNQLWALK